MGSGRPLHPAPNQSDIQGGPVERTYGGGPTAPPRFKPAPPSVVNLQKGSTEGTRKRGSRQHTPPSPPVVDIQRGSTESTRRGDSRQHTPPSSPEVGIPIGPPESTHRRGSIAVQPMERLRRLLGGTSPHGSDYPPSTGSGQSEVSNPSYPLSPKIADPLTTALNINSIASKRIHEADEVKARIQELLDEISFLKDSHRKREEEHCKREGEFRKKEEEFHRNYESWVAHCRTLEEKALHFQRACDQKEYDLRKLNGTISKQGLDIQRYSKQEQILKKQLVSEKKKYDDYDAKATTEIQGLEKKIQDCQTLIGRMSQINSQLSKRGLPETHDDRYFMDKLDDLVESIGQWARMFSRGQQPLTMEDLKAARVTVRVKDYIISAFVDLKSLLNAKNVGGKVRTRFVEAIMLRILMGDRLWKRHIGFPERDYENLRNLIEGMNCTEEEIREWSALTIHRLTKDNSNLQVEKEKDIDAITDMVLHHISSFGGSPRATREKLREIVSSVAELGLEMARLPFEIRPLSDLKPGEPFVADMMKDVDPEEEDVSGKTTIILAYPWVKVTYDEMGKSVVQDTYLSKARVSCIC